MIINLNIQIVKQMCKYKFEEKKKQNKNKTTLKMKEASHFTCKSLLSPGENISSLPWSID